MATRPEVSTKKSAIASYVAWSREEIAQEMERAEK